MNSRHSVWRWAAGTLGLAVVALGIALSLFGIALSLAPLSTGEAHVDGMLDLRREVTRYQNTQTAEKDGWGLVAGLDHCFDNPGVGAMGFHYINTSLLDTTLDESMPEALVYPPRADGKLELGAVEWIVPAAAWDAEGHSAPPTVHGLPLHLNSALGVYVLHAWIFKENPAGMFADWNPDVSCAGAATP